MYTELEVARSELETEGRLTYGTSIRLLEMVTERERVVDRLAQHIDEMETKCRLLEVELARVTRPGAEEE